MWLIIEFPCKRIQIENVYKYFSFQFFRPAETRQFLNWHIYLNINELPTVEWLGAKNFCASHQRCMGDKPTFYCLLKLVQIYVDLCTRSKKKQKKNNENMETYWGFHLLKFMRTDIQSSITFTLLIYRIDRFSSLFVYLFVSIIFFPVLLLLSLLFIFIYPL